MSMDQVAVGIAHKQPPKHMQVLSMIAFLMLFGSGLFHMFLFRKFTPVYTSTECGNQEPLIDNFTIGYRSIHVGLRIDVTCRNPNPYKIQILSSTPGRVFIGEGHKGRPPLEVGRLEVMPGSFLQEQGWGTVSVRMSTDITGADADALLPHLLEDKAVPITMELQFAVGISISFGVGTWTTSAPFKKDCGLNMAGMLVKQYVYNEDDSKAHSRLGPLVCRESFVGMRIPPVGEAAGTPDDGQMGFSAAQVAPTEVYKGEAIKNVSLGLMITLSFAFSVIVPFHIWFGITLPKPPSFDWLRDMLPRKAAVADDQQRSLVGSEAAPELEDPIRTATNSFLLMMDSAGGAGASRDAAHSRNRELRSVCPSPWDSFRGDSQKPPAPDSRGSGTTPRPRANSRQDRESSQPYKGGAGAGYANLKSDLADTASEEIEGRGDRPAQAGPARARSSSGPARAPSPDPSEKRPMLAHASSRRARGLGELDADHRDPPARRQATDNSWTPTEPAPSRASAGERSEGPAIASRESSRSAFGDSPKKGRNRSGSPTPRRLQSSPEYTPGGNPAIE